MVTVNIQITCIYHEIHKNYISIAQFLNMALIFNRTVLKNYAVILECQYCTNCSLLGYLIVRNVTDASLTMPFADI